MTDVSYWYDATLTVRVYLSTSPVTDESDTQENVEDELLSLIDGKHTPSALLSVHDVELGELHDDSALHRPG